MHLVTGASGFVGSNLARVLHARGEKVRVLDNWRDEAMPPEIDIVHADINDAATVGRAMRGVTYVHKQRGPATQPEPAGRGSLHKRSVRQGALRLLKRLP